MAVDGALGDEQARPDLLVGQAIGDQQRDVGFPLAEHATARLSPRRASRAGPVAVLMGVVTGTGGGVARDVLARQRPLILVGQIYALSAAAGATVFVVFTDARAPAEAARWTAIAVALILRLLAIRYSWSLPHLPARGARSADQPGAGA